MTKKQVWETIALDLKRAANYLTAGSNKKAEYYLSEAKNLFHNQNIEEGMKKIEPFIKFEANPEDLLLAGTLISGRI